MKVFIGSPLLLAREAEKSKFQNPNVKLSPNGKIQNLNLVLFLNTFWSLGFEI